MDWWAHQSHDLSHMCQCAPKDCGTATLTQGLRDTGWQVTQFLASN